MKKHLRWSSQNAKVKGIRGLSFGIPAFRSRDGFTTCPQAGKCAAICYARQGKYVIMPTVVEAREFNLNFIRTHTMQEFVDAVRADLLHLTKTFVRVHDSGDFFSQDYLDAWYEVARGFPKKIFYAYTKSFHLDLWSRRPENFRIVQSEGGLLDAVIRKDLPYARIFEDHAERETARFEDGAHSDIPAIEGKLHIGLVYHGRYEATPAQKAAFGWNGLPDQGPDLRGLLAGTERALVAKALGAVRSARENLSGTVGQEAELHRKASKLELIAQAIGELV